MPLATWKVLLRRSNQAECHYVATVHRASEPTKFGELNLRVAGQSVHATIIDVQKEFSTRAGVDVFTVKADEAKADPI